MSYSFKINSILIPFHTFQCTLASNCVHLISFCSIYFSSHLTFSLQLIILKFNTGWTHLSPPFFPESCPRKIQPSTLSTHNGPHAMGPRAPNDLAASVCLLSTSWRCRNIFCLSRWSLGPPLEARKKWTKKDGKEREEYQTYSILLVVRGAKRPTLLIC